MKIKNPTLLVFIFRFIYLLIYPCFYFFKFIPVARGFRLPLSASLDRSFQRLFDCRAAERS